MVSREQPHEPRAPSLQTTSSSPHHHRHFLPKVCSSSHRPLGLLLRLCPWYARCGNAPGPQDLSIRPIRLNIHSNAHWLPHDYLVHSLSLTHTVLVAAFEIYRALLALLPAPPSTSSNSLATFSSSLSWQQKAVSPQSPAQYPVELSQSLQGLPFHSLNSFHREQGLAREGAKAWSNHQWE